LFQTIRNYDFVLNYSEFNNINTTLSLFDISFENFSGSNAVIQSCSSMTSYIIYSFNSFMTLDAITSTSFSNGFLFIQNSSLIMNNSIFNNDNLQSPSQLSVFCLPQCISSSIILVENTIFLGINNAGNGSVKKLFDFVFFL